MGNGQFSYRFFAMLISLIVLLPSYSDAYGDIFIMNASLISNICTSSCDDTRTAQMLQSDCYRGCRFFDLLNKDSVFTPFDDLSALESCNRSCSEAYANETSAEEACREGCTVAQREYHNILTLSLQWLREFQRNRTFFETLLEITSAIVFPTSTKVDAGQFIEEVPNRKGNSNRRVHLKIKPLQRPGDTFSNKTYIAEVTRESYSLPEWVPLSALALSTVGTILTIGVCCYCCLFANIIKEGPNKSIDSDSPPSYEQLLRNGLLPAPNRTDITTVKIDKAQDQTDEEAPEVIQQSDHQVVPDLGSVEVHETRVLLTVRA